LKPGRVLFRPGDLKAPRRRRAIDDEALLRSEEAREGRRADPLSIRSDLVERVSPHELLPCSVGELLSGAALGWPWGLMRGRSGLLVAQAAKGPEDCDPGNSNQGDDDRSNDERGGTPGNPGRKGGNGK
jgi:hypothetical protein